MKTPRYLARVASLVAGLALAAAAVDRVAGSRGGTHYSGTLADGATWIADVPSDWNGVLLLYSHGFGPLVAADAPDAASLAALLDAATRSPARRTIPTGRGGRCRARCATSSRRSTRRAQARCRTHPGG